jgi:hypothetical protein
LGLYNVWNVCVHLKFMCWNSSSKVMMLENGAFGNN